MSISFHNECDRRSQFSYRLTIQFECFSIPFRIKKENFDESFPNEQIITYTAMTYRLSMSGIFPQI